MTTFFIKIGAACTFPGSPRGPGIVQAAIFLVCVGGGGAACTVGSCINQRGVSFNQTRLHARQLQRGVSFTPTHTSLSQTTSPPHSVSLTCKVERGQCCVDTQGPCNLHPTCVSQKILCVSYIITCAPISLHIRYNTQYTYISTRNASPSCACTHTHTCTHTFTLMHMHTRKNNAHTFTPTHACVRLYT